MLPNHRFYLSAAIAAPFFLQVTLSQDLDGDGASDSYEIATGFDPENASSTPPAAPAIGVNFVDDNSDRTKGMWSSDTANGYLPQANWNQVIAPAYGTDQTDIASPIAETIVDAAGNATTMAFTTNSSWQSTTNSLRGSLAHKLMNGHLLGRGGNVEVNVTDVPYASYDVYAYITSSSILAINEVFLNDANAVIVRPRDTNSEFSFQPAIRVGEGTRQNANIVIFRDVSGSSFNLKVRDDYAGAGLAAFQVVNRAADSDNDQVPDWWELFHQTNASVANGDADPDGDLLDNRGEYLRLSDPENPDSDNDGLSDFVETNTGVYVGLNDTGTDPNYGDSDDERLSDYAEVYGINPSDPNNPDTDGDGYGDRLEFQNHSSAKDSTIYTAAAVPSYTTSEIRWQTSPYQIHWNHAVRPSGSWLFRLGFENTSQGYFENIYEGGNILVGLSSTGEGLKAEIHINSNRLWNDSSGGIGLRYLGEEDLTAACGFSGVGENDFSDILRSYVVGMRNADDTWDVVVTIKNETTGQDVYRFQDNAMRPHPSLNDGTATWRVMADDEELARFLIRSDVTLYLTNERLDRSPIFSATVDTNDDGIADDWAREFGVTDATADPDGDHLTNYEEFVAGTNPNLVDTDGDGVNDGLEIAYFGNAKDANTMPDFLTAAVPRSGDFNSNGLPDLWENRFFFGSTADPTADPDGDGFSNSEEAIAGTNPLDASSYLALYSSMEEEGLQLSWSNNPDKAFQLQSSATLDDFQNVTGFTNGSMMMLDPGKNFFRLTASDRDQDFDGLTDAEERILGTDPTVSSSIGRPIMQDLDSDGIPETPLSADYAYFASGYQNRATSEPEGERVLSAREASRFLMQATYGPTALDIQEVRSMGLEAWIDDQIHGKEQSRWRELFQGYLDDLKGPRLQTGHFVANAVNQNPAQLSPPNISTPFASTAIKGEDQLRQRMAFAMSQIFVVSREGAGGTANPILLTQYYDFLAENAFGNYYDFLKKLNRTYVMGSYLSFLGNLKADPSINRFPDENFAREVMQLFTIGIHELNNDGTFKRDENGRLIETYDTDDIIEMARVMTGLDAAFRTPGDIFTANSFVPLQMYPERHDYGEKVILKRHTIPAREETPENGMQDIDDALLVLFNHDNTPPFVARSFIKFFVTDNPTPQYIERVANAFIDDGDGVRGNMEAVIKAILLDPEARDIAYADARPEFGRLRDPLVRIMHLTRLLRFDKHEHIYWWGPDQEILGPTGQEIFRAPNVFNFYTPDYQPPGPLTELSLTGGPFQILDTTTAVAFPNMLWKIVTEGFRFSRAGQEGYHLSPFFDEFLPQANDHEALVDHINLVLCAGRMKVKTRRTILEMMEDSIFANGQRAEEKIMLALYLAAITPDSAISR